MFHEAFGRLWCLVLILACTAGCSTSSHQSKYDFKYRWIGSDQWAAEHGSNVNIPVQFQDKKYEYHQIWGGFHTFERLLPSQEYLNDHPEYYALYEGERIPTQLCTSNEDVQRLVAEEIRHVIRDNPNLAAVTLGPNDNRFFCQCPRCRALDEPDPAPDQVYSRRLFLFYNRVSKLVHQEFPDVIIRFGAYDIYAAPPKDKNLTLPANTFPVICHFQKYCNNHPIEDPSCGPNARFRDVVCGWQGLAKDLFIYEYYYKHNWLGLPWPILHAIRKDIAWYKEHRVTGFYSQYNPDSAANLLNIHVAAALLLDADADVDRLVEDFCRQMFGPAWKEMRAYFMALEEAMVASGRHIPYNGYAFPHAPYVFKDEVLKQCDRLLSLAQAKADQRPHKENVLKFVRLMEYTDLCVDFLRTANAALLDKEDDNGQAGTKETARDALRKGKDLIALLKNNQARYQGVIPAPGRVNPYMQSVLDQLKESLEVSSD